ncbi:MAG: putative glutamine amidotransferase [bacterium]|nr:putative glutamine amidotransferase [bacterium]
MAPKPCIALIAPTLYQPAGPIVNAPASYVFRDYIEAVRIGGGYPFIVPLLDDPDFIPDIMGYFHGLLLLGGEDVEPSLYGGDPEDPLLGRVDAARDAAECRALTLALERDLPVLGICRGLQVMNVALGGSLIMDIPQSVPNALQHRKVAGATAAAMHDITFTPDSTMGAWYSRPTIKVNSSHHQAIDQLAPGLRVAATAADGVIEAVEAPDYDWVMAVQWHPERMLTQSAEQVELFEQFIAAAVRRAVMSGHALS